MHDTRPFASSLGNSTPYVKDDISLNVWYASGWHFAITSSYNTIANFIFNCTDLFLDTTTNLVANSAYRFDGPSANSSYCVVVNIK